MDNGTSLACKSPLEYDVNGTTVKPLAVGSHVLEVTLNGQQFTESGVTWTAIAPLVIDLSGGDDSGDDDADDTEGDDTGDDPGGDDAGGDDAGGDDAGDSGGDDAGDDTDSGDDTADDGYVEYVAPSPPSPAEIAADVFRYGISPSNGPEAGGTLLLIAAPGFGGGPAYKCKFAVCAEGELGDDKTAACGGAETTVDASFSDTELLSCYTPELLPSSRVAGKVGAAVDVSISLNGADFSVHPSSYTSYPPITFTALLPTSGPQRGDTMLTVTGDYFVAVHDKDYRCRFGGPTAEVDRQATLVNITTLICMSPPRPWLLAQTVDDEETLHRLVFDDGSALPASTEVGGDAEPNGIALKLTDSTPGRPAPSPSASRIRSCRSRTFRSRPKCSSAAAAPPPAAKACISSLATRRASLPAWRSRTASLLLLTRQFEPPPPFVAEFTEEDIDTWGDPHYTPPLDTGTYVEKVSRVTA